MRRLLVILAVLAVTSNTYAAHIIIQVGGNFGREGDESTQAVNSFNMQTKMYMEFSGLLVGLQGSMTELGDFDAAGLDAIYRFPLKWMPVKGDPLALGLEIGGYIDQTGKAFDWKRASPGLSLWVQPDTSKNTEFILTLARKGEVVVDSVLVPATRAAAEHYSTFEDAIRNLEVSLAIRWSLGD